MAMPGTIRVKLSSEEAGAIAVTRVVIQDVETRDLVERMLGLTGKDPARIAALLRGGVLVSGASRFRWDGFEAERTALDGLLATFPDPEPHRPFSAAGCVRAVLHAGPRQIEFTRDDASKRPLFRRTAFWDILLGMVNEPAYGGYSYRDRADFYLFELSHEAIARLRDAASLLRYSVPRDQVRSWPIERLELYVQRTAE